MYEHFYYMSDDTRQQTLRSITMRKANEKKRDDAMKQAVFKAEMMMKASRSIDSRQSERREEAKEERKDPYGQKKVL